MRANGGNSDYRRCTELDLEPTAYGRSQPVASIKFEAIERRLLGERGRSLAVTAWLGTIES